MHLGLPLYEGVDWNRWNNNTVRLVNMVSLFTREWIEICRIWTLVLKRQLVSLFTREWIEIGSIGTVHRHCSSLPLYEGVDWNALWLGYDKPRKISLPLYEGVDWNKISFVSIVSPPLVSLFTREWIEMWHLHTELQRKSKSPSLRGSGLKSWSSTLVASTIKVSLFTREWIEIANLPALLLQQPRLPLYEGVDWNK